MNDPVFYTDMFSALVVLIVMLASYVELKKLNKSDAGYTKSVAFSMLCLYTFLLIFVDALGYSKFVSGLSTTLRKPFTMLTFLGPLLVCTLFILYLYVYLSTISSVPKILFKIGAWYCTVQMIFCIYYGIHNKLFYFDEEGYYQVGEYYNGYMLVYVVLLVYVLFVILFNAKRIGRINTYVCLAFICIPGGCIIYSLFEERFEFAIASIGLSILLLYIIMQRAATDKLNNEKLETIKKSYTDELTGIGNRANFEYVCAKLLADGELGVVFADLNALKYTNDNYGHGEGDKLIKRFVDLLKNHFELGDLFRISGDEFVVVVRASSREAFDNRVKDFSKEIMLSDVPLAAYGSAYGTQGEYKELIASAEEKMYEMKRIFYKDHPEYSRKSVVAFKSHNANSTSADFSKEELFEWAFKEKVTEHYNWTWMREKLENYDLYGIKEFIFVHFDVKEFKMLNELYNHHVADNLLRKICKKMQEQDWIFYSCRCDNDNFAIMAKKMSNEEIEGKLNAFFDELSTLDDDAQYKIYFRCGVANISDVDNYRVLITDMAKMAQKLGNKKNETEIHFYTDKMKEDQVKGKMLKQELPAAINKREFEVYYQPKFEPVGNTIIGAEALIRWNKDGRVLSPGEFVPYLEKEAVIDEVDIYVLEEVCRFQEAHRNKPIPISVNMSKVQVYNPLSLSRILSVVNKYDIDRSYIEFELTETMASYDEKYLLDFMVKLREEGFGLSMDDFGTGFSSLSLLSKMPLTTLKIDKSFIDKLLDSDNEKSQEIIRDIIVMSKHLKINSIAEGVEVKCQKDLLKQWGCNGIQGYYYSKPVRVSEFEEMLKKTN